MRLSLALVCDHAEQTAEGKLDIRGVFNDLAAPGFPAKHDMVLVMVMEWSRDDAGHYDFEVNLTGPSLSSRAVFPHMAARNSGAIINISSIGGRRGGRGRGPYRAAKAGLINLTETLAAEGREHGIDVNCICPGGVDTEMIREIFPGRPGRSLMKPEEIAHLALFLAGDEGSSITGTAIDAFGPTNPIFS